MKRVLLAVSAVATVCLFALSVQAKRSYENARLELGIFYVRSPPVTHRLAKTIRLHTHCWQIHLRHVACPPGQAQQT